MRSLPVFPLLSSLCKNGMGREMVVATIDISLLDLGHKIMVVSNNMALLDLDSLEEFY